MENKYTILDDSTDKKNILSRILTLEELKKCQSDMYLELNKIMELIDDKETKNFLISNISINENVANFIFSSRLFLEPEIKRQFSKIKIKINPSKKILVKSNMIFWIQAEIILFFLSR